MRKIICPQCKKEEKKSTVKATLMYMTSMRAPSDYYDEEGNLHSFDDPNVTTQEYRCSNGHVWYKSKEEKNESSEYKGKVLVTTHELIENCDVCRCEIPECTKIINTSIDNKIEIICKKCGTTHIFYCAFYKKTTKGGKK